MLVYICLQEMTFIHNYPFPNINQMLLEPKHEHEKAE